ncbi:hypothetical protein [Mediterraneibacter agrestimuris]|uniref:hypothetical protein n=1 Tax=Mediterraneibacter agrestimuris TaxID=2941333 RepID=UPI00203C26C9|nr:hypothetical protein [Mediterraneibacter agrestimuris]
MKKSNRPLFLAVLCLTAYSRFVCPIPVEMYNKYILGGHGHAVAFIHKAAYIKGWRVEDQKQFFHLRGTPQE